MVGENKRKTEARLSGLILKIRKKGENERKVEERKVHVRWKRFDVEKGRAVIVSQKNGGGYRFIMVEDNILLSAIKERAERLFFSNEGKCYFGETIDECFTTLTNSADEPLDENLSLKQTI